MTIEVTPTQRVALEKIATANDTGKVAHAKYDRLNRGMLERLLKLGLITSEMPFMFMFHAVRITKAGREAIGWVGERV